MSIAAWLVGLVALALLTSFALVEARKQKRKDTYTIVAVERERR